MRLTYDLELEATAQWEAPPPDWDTVDILVDLTEMDYLEHESMPDQRTDHFTAADRKALIELTVDMAYMKRGMEELRKQDADGNNATKGDIKELRLEIDALKQFRWWMMGAIGASSAVGGLVAHFIGK